MDSDSLVYACMCGDLEAVRVHLEAGLDVDAPNYLDRRPLVEAVRSGCAALTALLLAAGADVGLPGPTLEETPLSVACQGNRVDLCELLMEHGAAAGPHDLEEAATYNAPDVVRFLLAQGVAQKQGFGSSLHKASRRGYLEIMQELIEAGADVNRFDADGNTPLQLACLSEQPDAAQLLLAAGADMRHCGTIGNLAAKRVQELEQELAMWRAMPSALAEAIVGAAHALHP